MDSKDPLGFSQVGIWSMSAVIVLVMSSVAGSAIAREEAASSTVVQGQTVSFDSYEKECRQLSQGEGLPAQEAKTLCACTIQEFKRRYSLAEFRQATQAAKTNAATAQKLSAVGEKCFEAILFEE